jgi:hypothetical protein
MQLKCSLLVNVKHPPSWLRVIQSFIKQHTILQDKRLGSFPQVPLLVFVVKIWILVVAKIMKYFFVRSQIGHFALNRDDSSIRVEMANDTKTLKHFYSCNATDESLIV